MIRALLFSLALVACGKSETKPAPPAADKTTETDKATGSADKPTGSADKPADKVAEPAAPADPHCAALREKYLAWSAERVEGALKAVPDHRKELQAEADKEAATAREKFVGACVEMGSTLDEKCFEKETAFHRDRAKHDRCSKIVHQLEAKMFRP